MTIIIDPQSSGIAGNMIIGALVDLGADSNKIKEVMEYSAQEFGGVEVTFEKQMKNCIDSTFCHVKMINPENAPTFKDFISKINEIDIDEKVKAKSIKVFERIAKAEAKVHGKSLDGIHFHEVGASDAVADVIGSIYAYYELGLDKEDIIGLPIAVGGGRIKTSHGTIPVPVPVVVEILKNMNFVGGPVKAELATPTGCAIYAEICTEIKDFIPLVSPQKVGYGAGRKDFDHPNVLRIIKTSNISQNDEIDVIETNIDHLTGEEIGYLFDKIMSCGASDVSITPIIMKKNRQGSLLKVISKQKNREQIIDTIFKETGSLGIRIAPNIHRGMAEREFIKKEIEIDGKTYEVTFKIGYVNGEKISERPEYEDLKKIAQDSGIALRTIKEMIQ